MTTYIHVPCDENEPPRLAACADTLEDIQQVLGGSYQPVPVDDFTHLVEEEGTFHLFIDEDGKAKDLPVNQLATRLGRLFPGDVVVGDAMLVRTDRWTDCVDLPAPQWERALEHVLAYGVWGRARTYLDMLRTSIDFLEGRLVRSPDHCGPLDPESEEIKDDLVHLTKHGLLTFGSQPTLQEAHWEQRAYAHFFVPDRNLLHALVALLGRTELMCLSAVPGERVWQDIPVTLIDGEASTWAGRLPTDEIHEMWQGALHPKAASVVRSLAVVEVIDPRWDGGRRMWDTLRQAVDELELSEID